MSEAVPQVPHICSKAKAGQKVIPHADKGCGPLCICNGYLPMENTDIVLADDLVGGTFKDDKCNSVTVKFCYSCCGNDCVLGCCFCGPMPCLPNWLCRECWCPGSSCDCKKTNTFQLGNGHFYTVIDKDTFIYHYLCCSECARYVRVDKPSGAAPSAVEMQR